MLGPRLQLGGVLFRDDGPDAGESRRERDVPEPAEREDAGEDVAAKGRGEPAAALEIAEERHVLEKLGVDPLPSPGMKPALVT